MHVLYNLIQLLLAPFIIILLPFYLIARPEKCKAILPKLGYGLKPVDKQGRSVVWIHALSVGEVTSAVPLVRQIKQDQGEKTIVVFSASTVSGFQLAKQILSPYCDHLLRSPFDILPVVRNFIKKIDPDLFILVETDFWPNLLHSLSQKGIPAMLVNGRVSDSSIKNYQRYRFFFQPIFDQFKLLSMQTEADCKKIRSLGIEDATIKALGNLKFADLPVPESAGPDQSPFPEERLVILAGSTHKGEESMLLALLQPLSEDFHNLHMVIAPRDIKRIDDIIPIADDYGFNSALYSTGSHLPSDITIVDTIGDLSGLYGFADICFIGGSLIEAGGHNPLEAARCGKVVLFGPHMDDFQEISSGLIDAGGALQACNADELQAMIRTLLSSETERSQRGRNGLNFVSRNQHVVDDHVSCIRPFL